MIEFGKTLREAREAKGLAIADIAERTHMMSSLIADLENEDFTRLPAPIYGRGFIKLYCETVGINPEPMIAEFMEIYNGNREPAIRERAVPQPVSEPQEEPENEPQEETKEEAEGERQEEQPHEEPAGEQEEQTPAPVEAAVPPPANEQLDLFSAPREPVRPVAFPPAPAPDPTPAPEPTQTPAPAARLSQYVAPFRDSAVYRDYGPAVGRWCVVAVVLCLVIGGIVVGIRALYRATSNVGADHETAPAQETVPDASTPPAPSENKTSRTPLDVPPLYVD